MLVCSTLELVQGKGSLLFTLYCDAFSSFYRHMVYEFFDLTENACRKVIECSGSSSRAQHESRALGRLSALPSSALSLLPQAESLDKTSLKLSRGFLYLGSSKGKALAASSLQASSFRRLPLTSSLHVPRGQP